jgi:AraC-like DNA-binding protein
VQPLIQEVVDLVRERMPGQGRVASALPGLYLYRWDAPQQLTPGRTSTMRVNLCVQGRKLMRVAGAEHYYDPVSYLVMRGETAFEACAVEAPYLAIALELSPQLVSQGLLEIAQAGHLGALDEEPPAAFTAPLDAALLNGMSRLLRSLEDPVERVVLGPLVVREIVFRLLLSNAASVMRAGTLGQQEREPIRRAMEFIEQRAFERLSVDAIARHVGMSPSHFAHRFSAIASVSPMRYLKHVRLERARQLLLLESERASAVASRVGYASEAHFNRDFKRQFGLAPASYVRAFERGAYAPMEELAGLSKKNAEPALGPLAVAR